MESNECLFKINTLEYKYYSQTLDSYMAVVKELSCITQYVSTVNKPQRDNQGRELLNSDISPFNMNHQTTQRNKTDRTSSPIKVSQLIHIKSNIHRIS